MKNFLIAVLIAIFSVQGAVAAMGNDIALAFQAQEEIAMQAVSLHDSAADDAADKQAGKKVSAALEELSDYMPFELPVSELRHELAMPATPPVFLLSPDLPRIKPPPRA